MARTHSLRGLVAIVVLSLAALMALFGGPTLTSSGVNPTPVEAASFEGFLQLDGIQGDSQDKQHPKEIELLSYDEGQKSSLNAGAIAGKVQFSDIRFRHSIDKASVSLALFNASGKHLKSATFSFRKAGGDRQFDFYRVKLSDVLVTSTHKVIGTVAQGPLTFEKLEASTGAPGISEEVSLSFTKIEWEFVPQKADGSAGTPVTGGWDLKANKGINTAEGNTETQ